MNKLKYLAIGMLIGAFALPFQWIGEPVQLAIGQTVTVDSTQSPIVVNAMADLADLTPSDGQSVIIKTGTEKGLWYYDKDSAAVVDSVAVLTGPGSVGRFLVITNDIGSIAAATAITAAQIDNDVDIEFGVFDADSPRSLTLAELKKTGVQVVNVVQRGADPTGVASSTAVIQAILDDMDDVRLYFPAGTYKITSTLTVHSGDTYWTMEGDGNQSILQYTATDGSACLDLNGSQHFRLKNFRIAGTTNYQNFVGIDFNGANRWSLEDVEITSAGTGIDFTNAWIGTITNAFVRYATTAFTGTEMNDVHGVLKSENCYKHFSLTTCSVLSLKVLGEGPVRTATSTIDNCENVTLDCYFEDNPNELATVPEITVGATTRCTNVNVSMRYGNGYGAATTVTADAGADTLGATAHGYANGTPILLTTTSALPAGLTTTLMYWVVGTAADTFQLAHAPGGSAIDITDTGTGVHTARAYPNRAIIALDDVNICNVSFSGGLGNMHQFVTVTSDTRNLNIVGADRTNVPDRPLRIAASQAMTLPVNYYPDPLFLTAIPTLSNSNTTNAEETTIKPDFCYRSVKVTSTGSVTSNTAYRAMTFAAYPHLAELKGRKVGLAWWQYYASDANYSSTASGNGPQLRIITDGASPAGSTETFKWHYRGGWHLMTGEVTVPTDATQITVYYYSNAGNVTSDGTMIAYFVGPLMWIGGHDNVQRVMNGQYTHHPNALLNQLQTNNGTFLKSTVALTNGAAAQTATMTNGPTAGNPTKWIPINDNGTTRYIPAW